MNDLISRQAVLDVIEDIKSEINELSELDHIEPTYEDCKRDVLEIINKRTSGAKMQEVKIMKLIIDIAEEDYIRLRDEGMFGNVTTFKRAVREGIPLAEQEPCDDAISRQAVEDTIYDATRAMDLNYGQIMEYIDKLPPVTPQPKTGHWIDIMVGDMPAQVCDQCKTFYPLSYTGGGHNYCPSCGSRMVEPQESEDKE